MSDWDDDASTLSHAPFQSAVEPGEAFTLVRLGQNGARTEDQVVVDGTAEVLVGTGPACQLRLADPTVSRRHATFDLTPWGLRVRDLGALNGVRVGAIRVLDAIVGPGERVQLGNVVLAVEAKVVDRAPANARLRFGSVVGTSREIRRLFPLFERLASVTIPVLVEGETGTGKEVLARSLHDEGGRRDGPFIVFDCTAISPSLIESELFGHEKGAFTGATAQRKGVFEQAHGGTLFIDELGDMPLELQPKLLRALEQSEVRRVGGAHWIRCDVRIVAATRRDLDELVAAGRFRDDLYHRLAVARVMLPPLRERRGDIGPLVDHFCERLGVDPSIIPRSVLAEWTSRPWPGNLRELRNAVAREVALGELGNIGAGLDAAEPTQGDAQVTRPTGDDIEAILALTLPYPEARQRVLERFSERFVERTLAANGGNVQRAAEAAGIALRYFQLLRARAKP